MADPVIRPVSSGLGPNLKMLQRVGDGASDPGAGLPAARAMTGGGAQDASTAGGLRPDTAAKYAGIPDPLRSLLGQAIDAGDATVE